MHFINTPCQVCQLTFLDVPLNPAKIHQARQVGM